MRVNCSFRLYNFKRINVMNIILGEILFYSSLFVEEDILDTHSLRSIIKIIKMHEFSDVSAMRLTAAQQLFGHACVNTFYPQISSSLYLFFYIISKFWSYFNYEYIHLMITFRKMHTASGIHNKK